MSVNQERAQDEHVQYLKKHLVDQKDPQGRDFVFISYRSTDWYVVLHDIVYSLVKDYGLHIYFDGSFDSHNSLWLKQFPENMCCRRCKGVLAFLDDAYATSYATLMELMYSQTAKASGDRKKQLPVVPVNLGKMTKITGDLADEDTGLGTALYSDGTQNLNAEAEQTLFDKTFRQLVERDRLKESRYLYEDGDRLTKGICSEITADMVGNLSINENDILSMNHLGDLVKTIQDACGSSVFGSVISPPDDDGKGKSTGRGKGAGTGDGKGTGIGNDKGTGDDSGTGKGTGNDNSKGTDIGDDGTKAPPVPTLNDKTTLKEFAELCESPEFCQKLRDIRANGQKQFQKQLFDYLMTVLLRGCDDKIAAKGTIRNQAKWNYCTYAVSTAVNLEKPEPGASQFTWQSNSRKALGMTGSGKLGAMNDVLEQLDAGMTLGAVQACFEKAEEPVFQTKDNAQIQNACQAILAMEIPDSLHRSGGNLPAQQSDGKTAPSTTEP